MRCAVALVALLLGVSCGGESRSDARDRELRFLGSDLGLDPVSRTRLAGGTLAAAAPVERTRPSSLAEYV